MVSIIKNQLLKHLSRFTKNLSADKINLSTFKGEGELTNLELNENVLTDLLELPSWLRLTKAWSNRVSFRIQWTKLKSVPIRLSLDEVNIILETCEELRPMSPQAGLSSYAAVPGKYSFIHKVIDGITVSVNTVNIAFNSPAFTASVQVSKILVESKTPRWQKADLRMSRIKEPDRGQLLIFKELEWQTVRIEAKSTKDKNLTPLRLITNQARCRIVIKKRLSDCFIIGSRMAVIFEDLLWVLTDSQFKAALHFLDSLAGLVQKATLLTRKAKAARKLEELPEYQAQLAQQASSSVGTSKAAKHFSEYDVIETSYHFLSQHIILHLCDDPGVGRSCHPQFKEGGALQISISKFKVDYYPYHLAKVDRKHWPDYRDTSVPHLRWLEQALMIFRTKVMDLVDRNKIQHAPLSRYAKAPQSNKASSGGGMGDSHTKAYYVRQYLLSELAKLMTSCLIIRIDDFTLYKVTSSKKQELKVCVSAQSKRKEKGSSAGDKDRMSLPEHSNIVHAEFIYFYYPSDTPFPLPPPKFYVHINPIQVYFDMYTCIWLNSFALNLHQSLLSSKQDISGSDIAYIDVKVEAILPKIIFESTGDYPNQRDRPKTLNVYITRATITNVRSLEQSSRADLAKCVDSFHMGSLFFGSEFPSRPGDFYIVTQKFLDHISATDNIRNVPQNIDISSEGALAEHLCRELFWTDAKDVWSINLEPVWIDFLGAKAVGSSKPVPFVDTVPITIWLHANVDPNSTIKTNQNGPKNADIHALTYISNLVSVQINHYQYLFLLRLMEDIAEMATFLSLDSNRILKTETMGSLVIGAIAPQVEVTFVMPSQSPGKESSGGDIESFVPDSSSIPDDVLIGGSSATVFQYKDGLPADVIIRHMEIMSKCESCPCEKMPDGTPFCLSSSQIDPVSQSAKSEKLVLQSEKPEKMVPQSAKPDADKLRRCAESLRPQEYSSDSKKMHNGVPFHRLYSSQPPSERPQLQGERPQFQDRTIQRQSEEPIIISKEDRGKHSSNLIDDPSYKMHQPQSERPQSQGERPQLQGIRRVPPQSEGLITVPLREDRGKHLLNPIDAVQPETAEMKMADEEKHSRNQNDHVALIRRSSVKYEDNEHSRSTRLMNFVEENVKFPNNINTGISSMKKGFKSMVGSTFKPMFDDASETLSIKSDLSSDSEDVDTISEADKVNEPVDAMFRIPGYEENKGVEVASEVEEDTLTTISDHSYTSSCRRRDLVSVSTFKLSRVEFLQQSVGFSSTVKVQIGNVINEDCSSIPWDEFQTKFTSRTKVWSDTGADKSTSARIKLRLDHDLKLNDMKEIAQLDFSDKDIQKKLFRDFLKVHVNDLQLTLSMSTCTGLADLFEDEIFPVPLPMGITLKNVNLHLNEDRPPMNITSPGPIPIDLNICHLFIRREEDGVFCIEPVPDIVASDDSSKNDELVSLKSSLQSIRLENEELKRAFERISKENDSLRRSQEEVDKLCLFWMTEQDKVSQLLEEKKKLLENVEVLQAKLNSMENNPQYNSKR